MIAEIGLLIATAETAIGTIKKAIAVGKGAHECMSELMRLFDAQDAVVKASTEDKHKAGRSDMAEAMESVMAAKRIRDMMEELQQFLIYSGQADVWNDIIKERNAIRQRKKAAELAELRAKQAKQRRRREIFEVCIVSGAAALLAIMVLYGVYLVFKYLR